MDRRWVIYGATGYTGSLIAQACVRRGLRPVLAGRDALGLRRLERARAAGELLCPGVGFDVVPTDCVAVRLAQAMPDATHLTLMFAGVDHLSAGTTVTSMEAVSGGASRVRRDGRIVDIPFGEGSRMLDFGHGAERGFVIPWGDVATARYSTGIPNIEVHIPWASASARALRTLIPVRQLPGGYLTPAPLMGPGRLDAIEGAGKVVRV